MGAPVDWLPRLMNDYVLCIAGERLCNLPPVIQALVAHFFLVTIHPFGDGNGRVSRLLTAGILLQRGYNVHGGFYALSDYFYVNDIKYHSMLHKCWQSPPFDLTAFFFDEMRVSSRQLLREVHTLAFYYHWSESEILGLRRTRRREYLELLSEALRQE